MAHYVIAEDRAVLAITGEDRVEFLQGLVSNDVARVTPSLSVYAALLTPQGKFLHDFFMSAQGEAIWVDCEAARCDDLRQRLSRYKLRAKVAIEPVAPAQAVALIFGDGAAALFELDEQAGAANATADGVALVDPRLPRLGVRLILPADGAAEALGARGLTPGSRAAYDALRIRAGVPDGSRDLPVENAILLENGIDLLNGVDWDKGCYMGQELTARTHYRALVKKRLLPVAIEGAPPPPGTDVTLDGKTVGVTRTTAADTDGSVTALAMLRLDAVEKATAGGASLLAGEATLRPYWPDWLPS